MQKKNSLIEVGVLEIKGDLEIRLIYVPGRCFLSEVLISEARRSVSSFLPTHL